MLPPGPALVAYLNQLRNGQSMRQFCIERGLDNSRVSRWADGGTPSVEHLRATAQALDMTLAEIMVICGFAEPEEFTWRPPRGPEPPSFAAATADSPGGDPSLTDLEKAALRSTLEGIRSVVQGVTVTSRSKVAKRRKSGDGDRRPRT